MTYNSKITELQIWLCLSEDGLHFMSFVKTHVQNTNLSLQLSFLCKKVDRVLKMGEVKETLHTFCYKWWYHTEKILFFSIMNTVQSKLMVFELQPAYVFQSQKRSLLITIFNNIPSFFRHNEIINVWCSWVILMMQCGHSADVCIEIDYPLRDSSKLICHYILFAK